jgi:hypothetical protein
VEHGCRIHSGVLLLKEVELFLALVAFEENVFTMFSPLFLGTTTTPCLFRRARIVLVGRHIIG